MTRLSLNMINPYQPPNNETRFDPFWKRFRRGMRRAFEEYRAGLVREKITPLAHVRAWALLILICFVASGVLSGIAYEAYFVWTR